ncbi:C40 family peptidase [Krasilnikovia sp. M28-CT-15]|uniref:C40 family peptidase n=1 Tax=Krasilnikovia sp. M28-CT-15 TaxID=3373540 RepID=UPI00399D4E1C
MKLRVLVAAIAALPVLATVGVAVAATGSGALDPVSCASPLSPATSDPTGGSAPISYDDLAPAQIGNARIIYTVAVQRGLPTRASVIAIATALQESHLYNLDTAVDHDSLGLFQQRPSQGWGTPAQILDPAYASNAFYDRLVGINGWQAMSLTEAAQKVQRSAFPDAYAKWEPLATQLAAQFATEQPAPAIPGNASADCAEEGDGLPTGGDVDLPNGITLPAGTPAPVVTAIAWALAQRGTPYHFGGDCTDPHSGNPAHQCDCSSLMQQAYRHAGINIPRTTLDQIHAGTAVPAVSAIAPGDLVLIAGSLGSHSRPRHVGMYIGQGLIVQAPHTGDVVKLTPLSAWHSQIAAIRRVVN